MRLICALLVSSLLSNFAIAEKNAISTNKGGGLTTTPPPAPIIPGKKTGPGTGITAPNTNSNSPSAPIQGDRSQAVAPTKNPNAPRNHSTGEQLKKMEGLSSRSTAPDASEFEKVKTGIMQAFPKDGTEIVQTMAEQRALLKNDEAAKSGLNEFGKMLAESKGKSWDFSKKMYERLAQNPDSDPHKIVNILAELPCECGNKGTKSPNGGTCRLMKRFQQATAKLDPKAVAAACVALFAAPIAANAKEHMLKTDPEIVIKDLDKPVPEEKITTVKE